jgi:hypothetical protein
MIWGLLFVAVAVGSVTRTSLFQDYACGAAVVGIPLAVVRGEWGLALFCVAVVAVFVWHWGRTA